MSYSEADKTKVAVEVFDKLADLYVEKYLDVSAYHTMLDQWSRPGATQRKRVLELACGPGNLSRYVLMQHPHWQWLGIDLSPRMVQLARELNPGARFEVMDVRAIRTLPERFDAALIGFCFPYLDRAAVQGLLQDLNHLLEPGSLVYISTEEGAYESSKWVTGSRGDQVFMYYYSEADLQEMLSASGFSICFTERNQTMLPNGHIINDLILITQKKPAD